VSLRKYFKRLGRKTAKIHTKVNRVFVPVASAAAGYLGGAPAAAAVTAIGAQSSYYFRATQARNEGIRGRAARVKGRQERTRVSIYGAIGGGAGMLGSGVTSLIAGSSFSQALGATAFGQGGANILGIGGTIFSKTPEGASAFVTAGNLAAQKGSSVPGLVTQAQLKASLAGGSVEAAEAGGASSGAGWGTKLGTAAGHLGGVVEDVLKRKTSGNGSSPYWFTPDGAGGGGWGGGDSGGGGGGFWNSPMGADSKLSPALVAALAVGAFLLLS
jgi:hypothetical protein